MNSNKPLGVKAYGSIPHLPGSRLGPGDHHVHAGQDIILTQKTRDRHDVVFVEEKLDGSCCAVANVDGHIVALGRAGYTATSSPYEQHHLFAYWVRSNPDKFSWLEPGERVVGEWLALVHGTHYNIPRDPFVAFDIIRGSSRVTREEFRERTNDILESPNCLSEGPPCSIELAMHILGDHGYYGAVEQAEGAVWRVERKGRVDFLAKYVRPDKVDGKFLDANEWNWRPAKRGEEVLG